VGENASDPVVYFADHRVIAVARAAQLVVGKRFSRAPGVDLSREAGKRQLLRIVEVEILLRRYPRLVRRVKTGDAEERLPPVLRDEFFGLLGDEGRARPSAADQYRG